MALADRAWFRQALSAWRFSERELLKLPAAPLPTIILIDRNCTYVGSAAHGDALRWNASRHPPQQAILPDGKQMAIGPISFASPDNGASGTGYFAMSLPSVWRAAGVQSGLGLERLMLGVMLHELMHTRQFYFANPTLAEIGKRYGLGDDIGDDSLQEHFSGDPAYVAAYEAELDALFAAAAAPSDAEARALAAKALTLMRARRTRWFAGAEAQWVPLDDIFLTMEGLGQWLAYAWLASPKGPHIAKGTAIAEERRGGRHWTQDEGLGLFLVIDRLVPGWQRLAFAPKPLLAEALLERATARGAS